MSDHDQAERHPPRQPLSQYAVVDTRDPDRAREEIGRIFCPHRLLPLGADHARFHARHHTKSFGRVSINYVAYGARVEIDPGCLERFFLLQITLGGSATVTSGRRTVEVSPRIATLLSPRLPTRMVWEEGCEKLIVLLPRDSFEQHLADLFDIAPGLLDFEPSIDLHRPQGAAILAQAKLMLHLAESQHLPRLGGRAMAEELSSAFETTLATLLSEANPVSTDRRVRPTSSIAPAHVRRAEDYIRGHLDDALTVPGLAAIAGSSTRALQEAFRHFRETTISAYILERRLEKWRTLLLSPGRQTGVGDAAFSVGLNHLGRAAAAYRLRFGEAPSETVRQRRMVSQGRRFLF